MKFFVFTSNEIKKIKLFVVREVSDLDDDDVKSIRTDDNNKKYVVLLLPLIIFK